jgi:hypothetical protein
MVTIIAVFLWWTVGFIVASIYEKLNIHIVDTNVDSYRLRCKILISFAGIINIFLIPILKQNIL